MIVLVPSTLALLPAYAGVDDPVPDLREACFAAVKDLVAAASERVAVLAAPVRRDNVARGMTWSPGARIGRHLLAEAGFTGGVVEEPVHAWPDLAGTPVLAVANGSARRGEKAPGHLDPRSAAFDAALGAALRWGDGVVLSGLDVALADDLWCHDGPVLRALGRLVEGRPGEVSYDADPHGVQYWVVRWP